LLSAYGLPVVIVYRLVMIVVLASCGLHSYVQYKRRGVKLNASERWIYLAFSLVFLFVASANFAGLAIAAKIGATAGPFNIGEFSMLSAILYMVVNFWVSQRRRFQ
jgi:hypothetical protein